MRIRQILIPAAFHKYQLHCLHIIIIIIIIMTNRIGFARAVFLLLQNCFLQAAVFQLRL
jgi:hypothetical protein